MCLKKRDCRVGGDFPATWRYPIISVPQRQTDGVSCPHQLLRPLFRLGKRIERPRGVFNRLRIEQLRREALSWREIARKMDVPKGTVYRYGRLPKTRAHQQTPKAPHIMDG